MSFQRQFSSLDRLEPNVELLRSHGWTISSLSGNYCVAWRGNEEVILVWRNQTWERIGGSYGFSLS